MIVDLFIDRELRVALEISEEQLYLASAAYEDFSTPEVLYKRAEYIAQTLTPHIAEMLEMKENAK